MIYLIEQSDKYKIGYTNDVLRRISQYETHNYDFKLLYVIRGDKQLESELHKRFNSLNVRSEWFNIDDSILEYFKSNGTYIGYSPTDNDNNYSEEHIDDEHWLKLYVDVWASACDKLTGNGIKFFSVCLKHSQPDKGEGNYFMISDPYLIEDLKKKSLKDNTTKYIKELIDNGLIYRIRRSQYGINPQIAYCGDKHSRAKLIIKITNQ